VPQIGAYSLQRGENQMPEFVPRNLDLSEEQIADFCRRWHIHKFALFGSVLRSDFSQDSDLDVLVTFAPDAEWSLLDHVQMEQELEALVGRKVDLLSRRAVERSHNWIRRQEILNSAEVVYGA
jgi:predicted nucleotidyltransferase